MANVKKPVFQLTYEGKDITEDISRYAISLSYTDAVAGESDEIQIQLEDTDGRWTNNWKPTKGDKITLKIGYETATVNCGTFEVDEIELSGPPDIVNFRALATPVSSPLRTKNNKAYENQTIGQIAKTIADKYGLTIQGEIPNAAFTRVTQSRESDLEFLKRISDDYGILFSIRGNLMVFTSMEAIEKNNPALTIDKGSIISYSLTDKTVDVPAQTEASYTNPKEGKTFFGNSQNNSGYFGENKNNDLLKIWNSFISKIFIGQLRRTLFNPLSEELSSLTNIIWQIDDTVLLRIKEGRQSQEFLLVQARKIRANIFQDPSSKQSVLRLISKDYESIFDAAYRELEGLSQQSTATEKAYVDGFNERYRLETEALAKLRANATLLKKTTRQLTGRISLIGTPTALAGNNFELDGFGKYDAICHIEKSTHTFTRGGGYVTDIEFKAVRNK